MSLVAAVGVVLTLRYAYGFSLARWLTANWLPLCVASIVWAAVLSKLLWLGGVLFGGANDEIGITGNIFYDFWAGRQLHPRPLGVDVKLAVRRAGAAAWLAFNVAALFDYWDATIVTQRGRFDGNLAFVFLCVSQIVYVCDGLVTEHYALCQYQVQHDGCGFMTVFGSLVFAPFVFTLPVAYARRHGVRALPHWACVIAPVVLFGGW